MSEEVTEYKPEPPHTTLAMAKVKRELYLLKEFAKTLTERVETLEKYIDELPIDGTEHPVEEPIPTAPPTEPDELDKEIDDLLNS